MLGKVKIMEFPNVFNMLSVLFYKNDDVKYLNHFPANNKEIVVLNANYELHFWSMETFKLNHIYKLGDEFTEIISIIPFGQNDLYLETKECYFVLEKDKNNNLNEKKKISKENCEAKAFFYDSKVITVNKEEEIEKIIDLL